MKKFYIAIIALALAGCGPSKNFAMSELDTWAKRCENNGAIVGYYLKETASDGSDKFVVRGIYCENGAFFDKPYPREMR